MPPPLKKVKVFKSANQIGTVAAARNGVEGREGFVLGKGQKKGALPSYAKAFRKEKQEQEIRHYQAEIGLVFSTSCMRRLIEEILEKLDKKELRICNDTVEVIQEVCEVFLTIEFHQAKLAQLHAGRVTLMVKDMIHVRETRHVRDGYYICYNEDDVDERIKIANSKAAARLDRKGALSPDGSASSL